MDNEELVLQYQGSQDEADRRWILAKLYRKNVRLIGKAASIYSGIEDEADLKQEGYFGLVMAAEKWDPVGGASFASYAYQWIVQVMQRYIHNCGSSVRVPTHRREQVVALRRFRSDFEKMEGREPSDEEIRTGLGWSSALLEKVRTAGTMMQVGSLSEPLSEDDPDASLVDAVADPRDQIAEADDEIQREQLARVLWPAVESIRGGDILRKRYREGKTRQEVAEELGIPSKSVTRLEERALSVMSRGKIASRLRPFLEDRATFYGYNMSGLQTFREMGASSVELAVLDLERVLQSGKT